MAPDRMVTESNLIYVVQDHDRSLNKILDNYAKVDDVQAVKDELRSLRVTLIQAALGFAASSLLFSGTIFVLFK